MKDKGYTLIELLGVMILLALLMGIVFPSIINSIKNSSKETDELTRNLIYNAAGLFVNDNPKQFSSIYGNTYCISLNTLTENNYLKGNLKYEGETLNDSKSVKVTYTDKYNYEIIDKNSCNEFVVDLMSNLIPVIYNGENWVVANTNKEWYNYENQEWANAVILNSSVSKKVGDIVTVEGTNPDAMAMFVWIPRYEYKIDGTYGKGGISADLPGEIEINFISKTDTTANEGYRVHPAFTFGVEELSGIWVGKFETTGTAQIPTILPNNVALREQKISEQFPTAQIFNNYISGDSHMMKNSEWGAVAYLSQSKYGKYGNANYIGANKEIYENKSSSYITGSSNGTPSQEIANTQCSYNDITDRGDGIGSCGGGASTTGNITGAYDMSGGSYEYVMGVFANSDGDLWSGNSATYNSGYVGFLGDTGEINEGISLPDPKYYDVYKASSGTTISSTTACNFGICYGHALSETTGWYGDSAYITTTTNPWMTRGGYYSNTSLTNDIDFGIFSANRYFASFHSSFRVVIASTP